MHQIREVVLDEIVLEELRRTTYYARAHTAEFVEFINQKSSAENRKELNAKSSELAHCPNAIPSSIRCSKGCMRIMSLDVSPTSSFAYYLKATMPSNER